MPPSPERGTEPEDDGGLPFADHTPTAPMTYTFLADMTPAVFPSMGGESAPPVQLSATHDVSLQSSNFAATPPTSPLTPIEGTSTSALQLVPPRGSHGKKRDPSYIPRPPNAFILFRSSFINSQQVPRKVEGNHRELSKIIGTCWRSLPLEERQKWEEKAVVAQAEHRKRYPDWRFRPGANALLKLQDGTRSKPRKRAATRSKTAASAADGAQKVDVSKDKGKRRAKPKPKVTEAERGGKVAQVSVEGNAGLELETGVKEWEGSSSSAGSQEGQPTGSGQEDRAKVQGRRTSNAADSTQPMSTIVEEESGEESSAMQDDPADFDSRPPTPCSTPTISDRSSHSHPYPHRSRSPERGNRAETMPVGHLSEVPLTQLYKRSVSVPAPTSRSRFPETSPHSHTSTINYQTFASPTNSWGHFRRDTVSFPMNPADYHPHHSVQPNHPHSWANTDVNRSPPHLENSWWRSDPGDLSFQDQSSYSRSDLNTSIPMNHGDMASGQYNHNFSEAHIHRSTWPPSSMDGPTVVEDPLMHLHAIIPSTPSTSTSTNPPNNITIVSPTASPHASSSSDIPFFNQNSTLPRSSFSALTGWDGDFNAPSTSTGASTSSAITDPTCTAACDDISRGWQPHPGWENQVQPIGLQGGSHDWDQLPPDTNDPTGRGITPRSTRNMTFDSGIYPQLHYNYSQFAFQHKHSNLQGSVYDVSDFSGNSGSA
ncbi:hypothetical protein BDN72DRAFT_522292 [Pluteus cervinus]|uniref:Uncharacterized protein n=1 Tax=Pluteus cervinus TaxID=181527 RepID=A0ACD3AYF2_9AGAR|nr:hypothetical protein BDN72DRAFT_522292 [Pluteus cervinus]